MGNTQSVPKHNFYLTKVSNTDLPLVPFIHTIVGYNATPVKDTDPLVLREILNTQDLCLEVFDILLNRRFKVTIPKFGDSTEKLGINVIKLKSIPTLLKIQIISVKESSNTLLKTGDCIVGIENSHVESEDELFYEIKSTRKIGLVVLRGNKGYVVECEGTELGCEIGCGLLYSIPEREYFMSEYTGRIKKEVEESSTVSSQGEQVNSDIVGITNVENQDQKTSSGSASIQVGSDVDDQKMDSNNNILLEKEFTNNFNSSNMYFISQSVKDSIKEAIIENSDNLNTVVSLGSTAITQDHLPAMKSVGSLCEQKEMATTGTFNMSEIGKSIEDIENSTADDNTNAKSRPENDRSHPQIPERLAEGAPGKHPFNVVHSDKTASYVYRSPRNNIKNQSIHSAVPINQVNASRIYDEAEVPSENQYFQGQHTKNDDEHANVVSSSVVCKENYIFKDGEMKMKDDVFEERRHDENAKKNWKDIFEEDDESLPFDEKRKDVANSIKDL
ncbi:uncharacterized protein VICG_01249 [Vittaforma corneae ATCC 50505]|uniref:PDZ domain-containing protein n=1 Tax=Vittaforma corneae (strain ATCC 50505) TaxID=993615 RepID=L2GMM4_VITCO|nr:uncharacterized protein VICG_01249 [Vittaforma corneae ATCC 50505]ELA41745.1 hypothetical protein VICG_01249 [Vittaforma corneae ATCC 50505]